MVGVKEIETYQKEHNLYLDILNLTAMLNRNYIV